MPVPENARAMVSPARVKRFDQVAVAAIGSTGVMVKDLILDTPISLSGPDYCVTQYELEDIWSG